MPQWHSGFRCLSGTPHALALAGADEEGGKGDAEGGNADTDGAVKVRKRAAAIDPSATLETADALRVKEFDPTFAVDPLFHKTSAQFDEGGAKGADPHVTPTRLFNAMSELYRMY